VTIHLRVWRQKREDSRGRLVEYKVREVSPDMSFLEMLDTLNDSLERRGFEPIAFEHDCREGICGSCGFMINGRAHGPLSNTTVCQLHMRHFSDGDTLVVEPWRARAFPVIKDLVVDRSAFDRIIQAGGYISVNTGSAPEANAIPVGKTAMESSLDAATCIGCGACVAACKNASAMLFTGAKISHLGRLPQGQPERRRRSRAMIRRMDAEGFGNCTNEAECSAECPKGIPFQNISRLNRDFLTAELSDSTDG